MFDAELVDDFGACTRRIDLLFAAHRPPMPAAPLSPLIETIVCRSAVDPARGFRPSSLVPLRAALPFPYFPPRHPLAPRARTATRERRSAFPRSRFRGSIDDLAGARGGRNAEKRVEKARSTRRMSYKSRNKRIARASAAPLGGEKMFYMNVASFLLNPDAPRPVSHESDIITSSLVQ